MKSLFKTLTISLLGFSSITFSVENSSHINYEDNDMICYDTIAGTIGKFKDGPTWH